MQGHSQIKRGNQRASEVATLLGLPGLRKALLTAIVAACAAAAATYALTQSVLASFAAYTFFGMVVLVLTAMASSGGRKP